MIHLCIFGEETFMNLNTAQLFFQVAKFSSFSEASRNIHIAQSSISKRIGELEEELNIPLFFRRNKSFELTPKGGELHNILSSILQEGIQFTLSPLSSESTLINLTNLRYFYYVAKEHSFSKAAEKLYIAVSALSRRIKDLEKEIGFQLFQRTNRFVTLTNKGEHFYYFAKNSVEKLYHFQELSKEIKTLRIGLYGFFTTSLQLRLLTAFGAQFTDIKFYYYGSPEQIIEAIHSSDIDIGYCNKKHIPKDLVATQFFPVNLVLISGVHFDFSKPFSIYVALSTSIIKSEILERLHTLNYNTDLVIFNSLTLKEYREKIVLENNLLIIFEEAILTFLNSDEFVKHRDIFSTTSTLASKKKLPDSLLSLIKIHTESYR